MRTWFWMVSSALLLAGCATSSRLAPSELAELNATYELAGTQTQTQTTTTTTTDEPADEGHGVGHALLWYIPNRISDVLDIVRLRLRLGPGFQLGARVTELADFNLGGYTTVFVGIPGPRRAREFNWPFGIENMVGAELSVLDGTTHSGEGPHYGMLEVGLGTQLLIVGFDLGVDVWEVVDFATGLVFIDPVNDDI